MSDVVLQSKCRALRTELRDMKYQSLWNQTQILSGAPEMYLRLMHFFFVEYSSEIKTWLVEKGYMLQTATDLAFIQQIFRVLQIDMNYRPKITVENFFKPKFALQKLTMCCEVAQLIKNKAMLGNSKPKTTRLQNVPRASVAIRRAEM